MNMTTETNIFEQAVRQKLRFTTPVGQLTVEDLWTLPLTARSDKPSLDALAVGLDRELKGAEESFVSTTKKDAIVQLKFDLVKYIITVRMQENEAKTNEVKRQAQIRKIDELIASKEDAKLADMSADELRQLKSTL
jgi:hypothetical protein